MDVVTRLRQAGVSRGDLVGLAVAPGVALGLATGSGTWAERPGADLASGPDLAAEVARIDQELRPRWVVWSGETAAVLTAHQTRLATCWDVAAVHRLLFGGWQAGPALAWARLHPRELATLPASGPPNLFAQGDDGDPGEPIGPSGHIRPEWAGGDWRAGPERVARWAGLARAAAGLQQDALAALDGRPMAPATATSESAAELDRKSVV